jgi:hypothetical protein
MSPRPMAVTEGPPLPRVLVGSGLTPIGFLMVSIFSTFSLSWVSWVVMDALVDNNKDFQRTIYTLS